MPIGIAGNGRIVDGEVVIREIREQIRRRVQDDLRVHDFEIVEDIAVALFAFRLELGEKLPGAEGLDDDLIVRELLVKFRLDISNPLILRGGVDHDAVPAGRKGRAGHKKQCAAKDSRDRKNLFHGSVSFPVTSCRSVSRPPAGDSEQETMKYRFFKVFPVHLSVISSIRLNRIIRQAAGIVKTRLFNFSLFFGITERGFLRAGEAAKGLPAHLTRHRSCQSPSAL